MSEDQLYGVVNRIKDSLPPLVERMNEIFLSQVGDTLPNLRLIFVELNGFVNDLSDIKRSIVSFKKMTMHHKKIYKFLEEVIAILSYLKGEVLGASKKYNKNLIEFLQGDFDKKVNKSVIPRLKLILGHLKHIENEL